MTHLLSLIHELPAGARVRRLEAELPDGTRLLLALDSKEPSSLAADHAAPAVTVERQAVVVDSNRTSRYLRLALHVEALERQAGGPVELKVRDWGKAVAGLSARLMVRAIRAGALAKTEKETGRDNGAWIVRSRDLSALLQDMHAEAEKSEPACWFESLIRRAPARAA